MNQQLSATIQVLAPCLTATEAGCFSVKKTDPMNSCAEGQSTTMNCSGFQGVARSDLFGQQCAFPAGMTGVGRELTVGRNDWEVGQTARVG